MMIVAASECFTRAQQNGRDGLHPTTAETKEKVLPMSTYDVITARIVQQLEAETVPWRKPWGGKRRWPRNLVSGHHYRGINVFLLACSPYSAPYWLTFKQAHEWGGHVRK